MGNRGPGKISDSYLKKMNANDQVFQKDWFPGSSLAQVISDPLKPSENQVCLSIISLSDKCGSRFGPCNLLESPEVFISMYVPRLSPRPADSKSPHVTSGPSDMEAH